MWKMLIFKGGIFMLETKTKKTKEKGNGEGTIYTNKNTGLLIGQYFVNGKRKSVYQKKKESKTEFKKRFTKIMNMKQLSL